MGTLTKRWMEWRAFSYLFVPSQIDIGNCKELSDQLKGNSIKETITNILESQETISYWNERKYYYIVYTVLFSIIVSIGTNSPSYLIYLIIGIVFGSIVVFYYWKSFNYSLILVPMPVNKILKYKLAICCDYAKLTASLLFQVPEIEKIYFIKKASHVTVGINLKSEGSDEIFVLDQKLPILTLCDWMQQRKSNAEVYVSENKNGKVTLDYVDTKEYIKRNSESKIDTEKLAAEVSELMKIDGNKAQTFKLKKPLEFYAYKDLNYDITRYSLIRAIKKALEIEFCGNIHKISKIAIIQNKEKLNVDAYYE
ncbi:MAG: hypothetical protein KAT05_15745 [Spirochaetes bacterium]|nr:hypothetical protein [Spirochaetota bacterium]